MKKSLKVSLLAVGIVGVVSIAADLLYLSGFGRQMIDVWKERSGRYVVRDVVSPDGSFQTTYIPKAEYDAAVEKKKADALAKKEEEKRIIREEVEWQKEEARKRSEPWSATATGFLGVEKVNCPPWDECKTANVARFVVSYTDSEKLSLMIGMREKQRDMASVSMGCWSSSEIGYVSYGDNFEKKVVGDEVFQALRKSDWNHLVTIKFDKPFFDTEYGTEGSVCGTSFDNFELVK